MKVIVRQILCLLTVFAQNVFSAEDYSKIDWCGADYQCNTEKSSKTNIACYYKGKCDIGGQCIKEKLNTKLIVDAHNFLRNIFATGASRCPKVKVTNMMALSWDSSLAFLAACNLMGCLDRVYYDDCHRFPPNFPTAGENVYFMYFRPGHITKCQDEIVSVAVPSWYDEINEMNENQISEKGKWFTENETTKQFTQMVWADITHVGCALTRKTYKDDSFRCMLTCIYGPGGNVKAGAWFQEGLPATACPPEAPPNPTYPGLCGPRPGPPVPPDSGTDEDNSSAKFEVSGLLVLILYTLGACVNILYC